MTTIEYAEKWFQLHDIPTIVYDDGTIYIKVNHGFELHLSTAEVEYRAELYKKLVISHYENYITCDNCCYDILDDDGDVMEHECIT